MRIGIVNLIANHDARFDEPSDSLDLTAQEYEKNEINEREMNFGAQKYCSNNIDIVEAGLRYRDLRNTEVNRKSPSVRESLLSR